MSAQFCPCGSRKAYRYCCEMYISGKKQAETAEKLMRSRYTAFFKKDLDYLIATLHPDFRTPEDRQVLAKSIEKTQWLGLRIIRTSLGGKKDKTGLVEFEAIYQISEPGQLHERSEFIKSDKKWFYTKGEILPGTIPPPQSACWCLSGKKYRQCHGKKGILGKN